MALPKYQARCFEAAISRELGLHLPDQPNLIKKMIMNSSKNRKNDGVDGVGYIKTYIVIMNALLTSGRSGRFIK